MAKKEIFYYDYPLEPVPTDKAYIPVRTYRYEKGANGVWNCTHTTLAYIPNDSISRTNLCKYVSSLTGKAQTFLVTVPPAPKNLAGNYIYKMSELAPNNYMTDDNGGFFNKDGFNDHDYTGLKTMAGMYKGCKGIKALDSYGALLAFAKDSLDFKEAFAGCSSLEAIGDYLDLKALNDASYDSPTYADRVKDMFKGCIKLKWIIFCNVTNTNLKQALTHKILGLSTSVPITIKPDLNWSK